MYLEKNEERSSRLKAFAGTVAGLTAGAFMLKQTGGMKNISRAFSGVAEAVSGMSDDLARLSRKEMDAENLTRIIKNRVSDSDSTLRKGLERTTIKNLDQSKGLIGDIRDYESFLLRKSNISNQMKDTVQINEVMKVMREEFKEESKEFFEQAHIMANDVIQRKHQYFESSSGESMEAIKESFLQRTEGGIFDGKHDEIAKVFEDALNNSAEQLDNVQKEFDMGLHPQISEKYKEAIYEKYSKDDDFFKETLDRAAKVDDFLHALEEGTIEATDENLELEQLLRRFKKEDAKFGELALDPESLRIGSDNEIYSTKAMIDAKDKFMNEVADTIPGKLFGLRSHIINKDAPLFYHFKEGSYDSVLAAHSNSKTNLLEHDFFMFGEKVFKYADGRMNEMEGLNIRLIGGNKGPQATLLNTLAGNTYYNKVENKAAAMLDLGTKGVTAVQEKKNFFAKFKPDSDWAPNVVKRLLGDDYDNAIGNEKLTANFFKDIKIVNSMYNNQTLTPSVRTIESFKELTSSQTSKALLETLSADNPVQAMLNSSVIDTDNFINKDLATLVNKYKHNKQSIGSITQVGKSTGLGRGKNVLTYEDMVTREVFKEAMLKEASNSRERVGAYSIIQGKLDKMNTTGTEIKNAKDLLNWSVLQKEGDLFAASSHKQASKDAKEKQIAAFNELLKTKRRNAQEQNFLKSFQDGMSSFAKENSKALESYSPRNNKVMKAHETGDYVAINKTTTVLDLIRNLNDEEKLKASAKNIGKQLYAGRNNMKDVTSATLIPFHLLNRLSTPLEKFGLGFSKESTKSVGNLALNIGTKRILPVMGASFALGYLNYEARNLTGTSLTGAYENAKANMVLGVKTLTDPFSNFSSTVEHYNPIAKYWAGDYKDKEEYLDYLEYGYDPVRKGRFWSFGSSSEFRGTKISYWKPNSLRLAHSNYYDESVYGGSEEKWKHSWLPTLRHPLSPIRALLNPYWLEEKNYDSRPYPVSGSLFADGSPWGAILNPTVGEIIKPKKKMHQEHLSGSLTDVRTLIARRNEEVRRKSAEKSMVRLNGSGFTPMSFNPNSMPSMGEAVFSMNIADGRVIDAGFEGQGYADSLSTINEASMPTSGGGGTSLGTGGGSGGGSGRAYYETSDANNTTMINALTAAISVGVASGGISSGSATEMIAQANQSIFAKSEARSGRSVINEVGTLHNTPHRDAAEQQKTEYLESVIAGNSKNDFVTDMMFSASQLSGMYGFLGGQVLPESRGYELERANMASFSNRFWDASVGGLGDELMEIARRFFPHGNHNIEQINPIRNTMPEWMPGSFKLGDPYSKLPLGDARLPGRGYESLNKLHSDKYGRYGAFDRYKILADISPTSEEYKTWKKIAEQEVSDPFLKKQMEQIDKRVTEQTKEHDFYDYKFLTRALDSQNAVIENVTNTGKFTVVGSDQQYSIAGITPLSDKENGSYIHQYLRPGMEVKLKYEDNEYRKRDKNGNITALVFSDGQNVSRQMHRDGFAKEKKEKETLADEYFALSDSNISMGHVWEAIGHMPIPYLHNKYLRIDSPMEAYKKEQIYGSPFSTWDHPIEGFVKPVFQEAWGRGLAYQALGFSTFLLSNHASSHWKGQAKETLAHAAFALTNPGGFAGGVIGSIPKMEVGSWARKASNVGAIIGTAGYMMANLDNPVLSAGNFALAGIGIANQLNIDGISGGKGALIGAAVGVGLSALKNPEFSLKNLNPKYIPKDTQDKWDIEEYYDRLEYVKYNNLYQKAARLAKRKEGVDVETIINRFEYNRDKNVDEIRKLTNRKETIQKYMLNASIRDGLSYTIDQQIRELQSPEQYFQMGEYTKAALAYKKAADTTIYGLNEYASDADVLRALPKYDRDFFLQFAKEKDPRERKKILKYISPYKKKALQVLWGEDIDEGDYESNNEYFQTHHLPSLSWSGWKPQVDLENVKMKTIENEGMLLSDFGIYESKKNEPAYMTAPEIQDKDRATSPLAIKKDMLGLLNGLGLFGVEVSVDSTYSPGFEVVSNITRMAAYDLQEKVRSTIGSIF